MKRKNRGRLFIISAPSGAGKTTLCQNLSSLMPNLRHSVSYTTRRIRHGEVNNRDYTFIKEDVFRRMAGKDEFVEWAEVHGNLYGTSRKRLEAMLNKGIDVILDVDIQGARQIRKKYKNGIYIFILPPSPRALKERLKKRRCNSKEEIQRRLKRAVDEIRDYKKYDYVIINRVLDTALEELKAIIVSEKFRIENTDSLWIEKNFLRRRVQ
ncbi:MAG: guanylate kinase [Nitrospirae bacterium CG_4_10_14_3_um_filter_44_29]|nr:MAG: guanylate kinase [Nitrospirae bacterium CG1_02_44_142]PIP69401.1 MAG: guanylate kinase [Nitrospirae bacterium CG22_combo_CG10-13_8_21_14_all_44_11]PIV42498.1 MAG: guanylate kinase [Nitrospirae bacterium CG02_land_8_20_14_3_00_44_33]PIV67197.1 MAG: guanylate kinase [Nitrospirae bacterium CG01_land_8_20_14_3_00_44_22]PIW89587.1 MAG: guanylate kinase [Nitrospirae bacterium CG_4_8_14_3_um_filter_44_28]PIX87316.1 MAG: guanylate kinase [Nitrospirae bacterium CG_4_10_14_3_um_filter_44_29]